MINSVLLIEDDAVLRRSIAQSLAFESIEVIEASGYVVAKDYISPEFLGVVLTDIRMDGKDGFDVLALAQSVDPDIPVIILTGEGDVPMALHATRNGAFDFLEKPCHPDTLTRVLKQALAQRRLVMRNRALEEAVHSRDPVSLRFPGRSHLIRQFRNTLRRYAEVPVSVHVWGEEGSGRAMAATSLFQLTAPNVIHIECSLSIFDEEGFLRIADENPFVPRLFKNIENASVIQQELLGDFIKNNPDRRIVTMSSNSPDEIPDTQLSRALFYQISVAQIEVPPLRLRPEDVFESFHREILQLAEALRLPAPVLTAETLATISDKGWVGNLSELRNYAQRVLLDLQTDHDYEHMQGLNERLNAYEKAILIDVLKRHKGQTSTAALELSVPLKTLYDRLNRHDLKSSRFR